jgi:23S rRNA pseudouridine2605 synthase
MAAERVQKILASAGVASRRASEELILAGRVTVNGRLVRELGVRADPERDEVRLDGRPVRLPESRTYLLLNKPRGYTSTAADPHARYTVMEFLPEDTPRVYPVGRLDKDSEGLLLFTDDGELAERLLHPRYHIPKEYAVLVRGNLSELTLERLRRGVQISGAKTAPAEVEPGEPPPGVGEPGGFEMLWLRIVLHEGRKRQIREMCEAVGLEVVRLWRVRVGRLKLGTLRQGRVRHLTRQEIDGLRKAAGMDPLPKRAERMSEEPAAQQFTGPPKRPPSPRATRRAATRRDR